jgi:hypothetical protein
MLSKMKRITTLLFAVAAIAISSVSFASGKQPPGKDSKTVISAVVPNPSMAIVELPSVTVLTPAGENIPVVYAEVKAHAMTMANAPAITSVALLHYREGSNTFNKMEVNPINRKHLDPGLSKSSKRHKKLVRSDHS